MEGKTLARPLPAWLTETHEHYLLSQAWPGYQPDLSLFQLLAGVQIHGIYERKKEERQAEHAKGMFNG